MQVDAVLAWYDGAARDLPWRRAGTSPWGVLVSEVMLQQTPVARVRPVYDAWMTRWPTPATLAAEPAGAAIRAWGRLGYPRRALRLHAAAVVIVERHDGYVPADLEALLALPGVGDYTARAVASFGYGRRHAVIDVNVERVITRAVPDLPHGPVARRRAVELLLPAEPAVAARASAAVMELGALVCRPRAPRCGECPLAADCRWEAPAAAKPRRRQGYAGTDRQVRGDQLALLREASGEVRVDAMLSAAPDPEQAARALAGLLADGLAVLGATGGVALP